MSSMPAAPRVVHSVFDGESLIGSVLSRWDVSVTGCRLLSMGLSDIYELEGADRHILRLSRQGRRTQEEIAWEFDLLEHVGRSGGGAVVPIRDAKGAAASTVLAPEGPRQAALFAFVADAPLPDDADYPGSYGAAAAKLHNAMEGVRLGPGAVRDRPRPSH